MAAVKTRFENLAYLPKLFISLWRSFERQKQFLKVTLIHDIEQSKREKDNTLTDRDYKKMTGYYGFAVPALLGEGFCMLRGRSMSVKERYAITYMGALTGLFDDFFDEQKISEEHIMEMITKADERIANNSNERLFVKFCQVALKNAEDADLVKKIAVKVFDAQVLSRKQKLPYTELDEIKSITLEKGGLSLLFYRSIFTEPISESEERMLSLLGGIGQLENDIFDIYKDSQQGIRTLATLTNKIDDLRKVYVDMMVQTFEMVRQTPYTRANKNKFLHFISFIISRGLVCLDFLEEKEPQTNHQFVLNQYEKKDLICDMGKVSNTLKLFNHYTKIRV
jgi:hypothetical protein